MKIVEIKDIHAEGNFAFYSFLKVTTDEGIVGSSLVLPNTPGWGIEVNEEAVKEHPPGSAAEWLRRKGASGTPRA